MKRRFVSKNVVILFLLLITTIDASRILYLPLPKIHSSHHELKSSPNVQEEYRKKPYEQRSTNNEFIPLSALERNMYEEQYESEKPEDIDWDSLVNERPTRYHTNVNELSPVDQRQSDYLNSLQQQDTQQSNKIYVNDADTKEAVDTVSQVNDNEAVSNPWIVDTATGKSERLQATIDEKQRRNDVLFLVLVSICSLVGVLGLISAAIFWYKIQKRAEAALDSEYPSYGVTGPGSGGSKISPSSTISDRKLAQSAQMFHYQQQRQQMMAQEKAHLDTKPVHSDDSDDEAPGGGDYTVYECPGLAPTGEMEVRNPLFSEPDSPLTTPAATSHPTTNNHYPQLTATTTSPSSSPPKEKFLS